MAAGPWVFTTAARLKTFNGTFNYNSDSYKLALFLSTSNIGLASTTYAGVTNEHANANGYTTGGKALTNTLTGGSSVTYDVDDQVWTASGGPITARFGVVYEVGGDVVCYCLLDAAGGGTDVTATDGNPLNFNINASGVWEATFP